MRSTRGYILLFVKFEIDSEYVALKSLSHELWLNFVISSVLVLLTNCSH